MPQMVRGLAPADARNVDILWAGGACLHFSSEPGFVLSQHKPEARAKGSSAGPSRAHKPEARVKGSSAGPSRAHKPEARAKGSSAGPFRAHKPEARAKGSSAGPSLALQACVKNDEACGVVRSRKSSC